MADMDNSAVFTTLYAVCDQAVAALSEDPSESNDDSTKRMIDALTLIRDHGRGLEPVVAGFTATFHHFDFDPLVPGNGYRSLVKVVRACLFHIIQKGRYIASNCRNLFFRAPHNAKEIEAYCSTLCQLRALLYLAQRLLHDNHHDSLYFLDEGGLSTIFRQEYASMHKACFYGRCLGFQFSPAVRPFLQTLVTGLVSFGQNYKKHKSIFVEAGGMTQYGAAASSFLTSGKYVIDPELRGVEFERAIQTMDTQFWKTFWNITETEMISGLSSITSTQVQVNRKLSVPPSSFSLPLTSDPQLSVTIWPPVAHWGPGPVNMRLISHRLLEGQNSEEMLAFSQGESTPISMSLGLRKPAPPSPGLLVHFHGGGFVAHTSKSHTNYLKSWARDLGVPILSVDYSLAPEAPFPRALEECFYAYCWALKHCHLLGSTGERVCLAGDSAGGNLSITVAMRAMAQGVRLPDGILAAYPVTLLTPYASPSRLLTVIDPLLPLGVLYKCLNAYAGTEPQTEASEQEGTRKTSPTDADSSPPSDSTGEDKDPPESASSLDPTSEKPQAEEPSGGSVAPPQGWDEYPEGFQPLRSGQAAEASVRCSPVNKNPYVSPLLAPDSMLQGLPPIHIVACSLDAMLDDSVMFAKRLRLLKQPVTLCVVEDLPHGFLSLQLCKETQEAYRVCLARIREVFDQHQGTTNQGTANQEAQSAGGGIREVFDQHQGTANQETASQEAQSAGGRVREVFNKHRGTANQEAQSAGGGIREVFDQHQGTTNQEAQSAVGGNTQEIVSSDEGWTRNSEGQEQLAGDEQDR